MMPEKISNLEWSIMRYPRIWTLNIYSFKERFPTTSILKFLFVFKKRIQECYTIYHVYSSRRAGDPEEKYIIAAEPRQLPRSSDPPSTTRWELAHKRAKGRFKRYITPPLEDIEDQPREPPAQRWQKLPKDMDEVNIGNIDKNGPRRMPALTLLHQELCQQVIIDANVDSDSCLCLLKSVFGPNSGILFDQSTAALSTSSDQ